jgi:phosphoenolpyruvate synthase/pyruvate phosphate dikinase
MTESPYIRWSEDGLTTTPDAYREFVRASRLRPLIETEIRRLRRGADIVAVGALIRLAFFHGEVPAEVAEAIVRAYEKIGRDGADVTVVSGSVDEPVDAFLTGPREVFSQVSDTRDLLAACKRCWAASFSNRAIMYREVRGIDHLWIEPVVSVLATVKPTAIPSMGQLAVTASL